MALSNIWQINGSTFDALKLSNVRARFVSQAPDVLTFSQSVDFDADAAFAYGDTVTVLRGATTWFKGMCTDIRRSGSGQDERIDYVVSGPWFQLEQVIYQQAFSRYVGGVQVSTPLARIIVGTDTAGLRLNSGQVIAEVVNFAITALGGSSLLSLGSVEGATEMPYEELNALSCAEVIKRVLRWNPDTVAFFDYSAATPQLNFQKRASLASKNFDIADVVITNNSINPRYDLQKAGVVVQFERTDSVGGIRNDVIITDTDGVITDPMQTLYLFFNLEGSSRQILRQEVKTSTIQITSAAWWQKHHPKLSGATGVSVSGATKVAADDGNGTSRFGNDGTSYTKSLDSGSVVKWMIGVGANDQDIEADVTYTVNGNNKTERLRLRLKGTNADSKTYTTTGDFAPAEPTPTGLAAAILGSLQSLQYDGQLTLTELDAGSVSLLNKTINIIGGRSEWETMAAQVYDVSIALESGSTQISFGPAKHLAASDLFQLMRNVRTRQAANGSSRLSIGGGDDELGQAYPGSTVADDGGAGVAEDYPLKIIDNGDGTLTVRASIVSGLYNSVDITETILTGQPTAVWLKVDVVSAIDPTIVSNTIVPTTTPAEWPVISSTTGRLPIGVISWNGNVPTITQFVRGGLTLYSCDDRHFFESLY